MKNKIFSLITVIALMINCISPVYADGNTLIREDKALKYTLDYNQEVSMGIAKEYSMAEKNFSNLRSVKNLDIELYTDDGTKYEASGVISLPSGDEKFSVQGDLATITLKNGTKGKIGTLSGIVEDEKISMSVHLLPEKSKFFVYVTVGSVTGNKKPQIFTYGKMFDEMNELVSTYFTDIKGVEINKSKNYEVDKAIVPTIYEDRNADDYNVHYRGMGVGRAETINGEDVDLVAVTLYTPRKMRSNESYKAYVKVNGSINNARYYVQNSYNAIPGAMNLYNKKGTCKLYSDDNDFEFSNMDPGDESWSVQLPIPYYIGGAFDFLPRSINIGFSTIKTVLSKNSGSLVNNSALWKHNHSENIDWDSDGPAATKKGYAGLATVVYHNNSSNNQSTSICASGTVEYEYSSFFALTQYLGHFTAESPKIDASVKIPPRY